jgi:KAP family P-loop domain
MWPDNETANDLIGFQVHADLIRAVVTNPKMLPLTIGIFGDWGGGKTSIMKMLERDLDPDAGPPAPRNARPARGWRSSTSTRGCSRATTTRRPPLRRLGAAGDGRDPVADPRQGRP